MNNLQKSKGVGSLLRQCTTSVLLMAVLGSLTLAGSASANVSGAIFTTKVGCTVVNGNLYDAKTDVYLDGGPMKPGAAGLPDGSYYVQVTDPSGATVLGTSVGTANETPIIVLNGEFAQCYELCLIAP